MITSSAQALSDDPPVDTLFCKESKFALISHYITPCVNTGVSTTSL